MQGGNLIFRNRSMQTGSSGTLIGWKSGQTTYVPLWDRMKGAWQWTPFMSYCLRTKLSDSKNPLLTKNNLCSARADAEPAGAGRHAQPHHVH
jgi:hypothetical protein